MVKAIKALKDWKAPWCDQIHSKMLKAEELVRPRVLTEILKNILGSEQGLNQWQPNLYSRCPRKLTLQTKTTREESFFYLLQIGFYVESSLEEYHH